MNESLPISPPHMPVERPPLLIEHLPHHPYELLHEVFSSSSSCDTLKAFLVYWLRKFDNERDISDWKDYRRALLDEFYFSLLNLVEALQRIEYEKGLIGSLRLTTIGQEKTIDPITVIRQFCQQYLQTFTRRELWCFVHAVLECATEITCKSQPDAALDLYEKVLALTETAYVLHAEPSPPIQSQIN